MAVRLARYLQRSLCTAPGQPCSTQISGGGGLLLVPELQRQFFVTNIKRFKEKNESFQKHYFGTPSEDGASSWWDAQGLTGELDDKLEAGAQVAFRQIATLVQDASTDWEEQLFIGPHLRAHIADQCADWRAAGYEPVVDIQELTCEVLAPVPGPAQSGPAQRSKSSAAWFALLWLANCAGLANYSVALNVPVLITANGGSLKLVKSTGGGPEAAGGAGDESCEEDAVMEASLGNNVWIFSCLPRKVITMSSEDYEWKLVDINGVVRIM